MTAALDLPVDVRLMNMVANTLFVLCALLLFALAAWWGLRHPVFELRGITVVGDVVRHSEPQVRANIAPRLAGNFITIDLNAARVAFESLPWVRRAVVQRDFPWRLRVTLHEHRAIAFWGPESGSKLVNEQGDIFEANPAEADGENMPRLIGPDSQVRAVLAAWRAWRPLLQPLSMDVEQLELAGNGSWRLRTDTGAVIEMGRGSADELAQRLTRWVHLATAVAAKQGRRADDIESADLRYPQGFAVRLRGVGTGPAPTPSTAARAPTKAQR